MLLNLFIYHSRVERVHYIFIALPPPLPPPDIPEAQLQYYLICDENCYPNPFDEYQMDAMVALDMVASQQDEIMAFASNNSLAGVEVSKYSS